MAPDANNQGEHLDMPPDSDVISRTQFNSSAPPQDLLLVVFIHGFKGTDSTFRHFPERLSQVLSEKLHDVAVETVVFPAYETKGELNAAVIRFADWLTNLTVQREVANGGGAGKAKVILCGHSMGGLLAADALIDFVRSRPDSKAPLWPNIVACLAYDTPFLGLNPLVFQNKASEAAGYARTAQKAWASFSPGTTPPAPSATPLAPPSQSVWSKWAPTAFAVGGALLAGAAAGTAYYRRGEFSVGYTWATDHMKYVGNLWDVGALQKRMKGLTVIESEMGVMFRIFYTNLPPRFPQFPDARTFVTLPTTTSQDAQFVPYFLPTQNTLAEDEISAHTGMFDAKTNDGYEELVLLSAHLIRDVIVTIRNGTQPVVQVKATSPNP